MALIELTSTEHGSTFSVDEDNIVDVTAEGTGSDMRYLVNGVRKEIEVDEAPAAIVALGNTLYTINLSGGDTMGIQVKNIDDISGTTEAVVKYNASGARSEIITSSDDYATVSAAVALLL